MLIDTQEMQFACELADRVILMDAGRIVEQGTPAQLFDAMHDQRTESCLRRVRLAEPGPILLWRGVFDAAMRQFFAYEPCLP